MHDDDAVFIGWFRQEYLQRVMPGSHAEVILDGIPGRIFAAEVDTVFPVIAEGQLQPRARRGALRRRHPAARCTRRRSRDRG